jgi:hypothetical protein
MESSRIAVRDMGLQATILEMAPPQVSLKMLPNKIMYACFLSGNLNDLAYEIRNLLPRIIGDSHLLLPSAVPF